MLMYILSIPMTSLMSSSRHEFQNNTQKRSYTKVLLILLALVLSPLWVSAAQKPQPDPSKAFNIEPTLEWAVKVSAETDPSDIAKQMGMTYMRAVEGVPGWHVFRDSAIQPRSTDGKVEMQTQMESLPGVKYAEPVMIRNHVKQAIPQASFSDPRYSEQWHWQNRGQTGGVAGVDINVVPAWLDGYTGEGSVVAVLDDGLQWSHPDLVDNYRSDLGRDYTGSGQPDNDPMPQLSDDDHGTAVAGIVAARDNEVCGVGGAYRAGLTGIRILSGGLTDPEEAEALRWRGNDIDIYNNSWGPGGDGVFLYEFSQLIADAIEAGATSGRNGRGSIYVWAAGNNNINRDIANNDAYNNSIYTIAVGAIGQDGVQSSFSEGGSSLLVVAPSEGGGGAILTTDRVGSIGYSDGDCTEDFSGTSAAAPIVSAVAALILQANPNLTWRDMQAILSRTATRTDPDHESWFQNGAGFWLSHNYGFGLVDATAAVRLARDWSNLPASTTVSSGSLFTNTFIPDNNPNGITVTHNVTEDILIEHVEVRITSNHSYYGDLQVELTSPDGTTSILMQNVEGGFAGQYSEWQTMSVQHWGERSTGIWRLKVSDRLELDTGNLQTWELVLHGTPVNGQPNRNPVPGADEIRVLTASEQIDPLANDIDPDGDTLSVLSFTQPAHGSIEELDNGLLQYTPNADHPGYDAFVVKSTDGKGGVAQNTVRLIVPYPVVVDDLAATIPGREIAIPVLANDYDPDGLPLTITRLQGPRMGSASIDGENIRYMAAAGFSGIDKITYTVTDGVDGEVSGVVEIHVTASDDFALVLSGGDDAFEQSYGAEMNLLTELTIEAWIRLDGWGPFPSGGYGRIFDNGLISFFVNDLDNAFYNDRSLVFYVAYDDEPRASTSNGLVLFPNVWQHVAVTYRSGSGVNFYVNGARVGANAPDTLIQPTADLPGGKSVNVVIGNNADRTRGFEGAIDEVRIWNVARTASQIFQNYTTRGVGDSTLVTALAFDEGVGPNVIERSGDGSTSVLTPLTGDVSWTPRDDPYAAVRTTYPGAEWRDNGWWESDWLGFFQTDLYPFTWHFDHGWIYPLGPLDRDGDWLFTLSPELQWIYTSEVLYPFMWSSGTGDWLWYQQGTSGPREFYDYRTDEIIFVN